VRVMLIGRYTICKKKKEKGEKNLLRNGKITQWLEQLDWQIKKKNSMNWTWY
jgi:hypothetical protein